MSTPVPVRSKEQDLKDDWILFGAHPARPEFRKVEILGYLPMDESWKCSYSSKSKGTRRVPLARLSRFAPKGAPHFLPVDDRTPDDCCLECGQPVTRQTTKSARGKDGAKPAVH